MWLERGRYTSERTAAKVRHATLLIESHTAHESPFGSDAKKALHDRRVVTGSPSRSGKIVGSGNPAY